MTGRTAGTAAARPAGPVSVEAHWRELVTTALLGTDRRSPPEPPGPIAELVEDTVRAAPSERMLAQVAACTAVRRAGVLPGPELGALIPPDEDDRPPCVPAAAERWHHITRAWPVLEDEWMLTLIAGGWRAAAELVPAMLLRHRGDAPRRARALVAAGALGPWLVEHIPELAPRSAPAAAPGDEIGELPHLPIPPDLSALLDVPGAESGRIIAGALESGSLGAPHRAVLVNLVARLRADALTDVAAVLESVDASSPGHGLAGVLRDLALTRHRMLDELSRSPS